MSSRRAALLIATIVSTCAVAAPMRIALHPLLVIGGEGTETASLQALFATKVIALGAEPVPSDEVTHWLASHGGHCENDACLAALARGTGASRTLQVSISPYSPRVVISGRMVSQSGTVLTDVDAKSFPRRQPLAEDFEAFLKNLDLDAPEPAPLVAVPPAQVPVKPVAPAALAPQSSPPPAASPALAHAAPASAPTAHPTMRLTSYVVGGVGVAALAIAGGVALAAKSDRNKFELLLDPTGRRSGTSEAKALDASLTSRTHLVNGLLAGGCAALVGGAVLWWLSRPSPVQITLAPRGTGIGIAGTF